MKKMIITAMAAMMAVSMAACGQNTGNEGNTATEANTAAETNTTSDSSNSSDTEQIVGGWEKPDSPALTKDAENALNKATENLEGETYKPVALLSTQVVAGTNYKILCRTAPVVPDANETWSIVTVYEDLDGNCEITDVQDSGNATDISDDEEVTGGWEQADSPVLTDEAKQIFDKGFADVEKGYECTPVALLSYQVVAGENYCYLVTKDSDGSYAFAYLYEDLDGNVSLQYTVDFSSSGDTSSETGTADSNVSETD